MAFTGPYPTVFSGNTNAMVISATTFSGGVTNAGTIGPGGISVISSTFLSGGILDDGIIAGGINIDSHSRIVASGGTAIGITANHTFGGGVTNSGTISAQKGVVAFATTLIGGIDNRGTISAGGTAVLAAGSMFSGGISNSGLISAGGQAAVAAGNDRFSGGIVNALGAIISAPNIGIGAGSTSGFSGGIANRGTIAGGGTAVTVAFTSLFTGGITNSGAIASGRRGIGIGLAFSPSHNKVSVLPVSTFTGGIFNQGSISAGDSGIVVFASVFAGGITNTGTILSQSNSGIFVSGASVSDGRHAASVVLLGNYIAGSFVIGADGHGGTLVTEAQQTHQPLLARPRA